MNTLKKHNSKILILILIFIISAFPSATLFSQGIPDDNPTLPAKPDKPKKQNEYKIALRFPLNVYNKFKFTEETVVTRKYSDDSELSFTRKITVYFTYNMFDRPVDGFTSLKVSIDSLDYFFTDGKKTVKHFSQDDSPMPLKFIDYAIASNLLGQQFEMVFSPYNELSRIESERIDMLIEDISNPMTGPKDTIQKFITLNWLSDQHIAHWTDIQKGVVPVPKITDSSVWKSPFMVELDGVPFRDSISSRLEGYNAGKYTIVSETNNLTAEKVQSLFYDIPKICNVVSGKGKGAYKLVILATGGIDSAEGNFEAEFKVSAGSDSFTQKINSKLNWELTEFVRFK